MLRLLAATGCMGLWIAALMVGNASPSNAQRSVTALARPLALPFLWRTLEDATEAGDSAEVFAKAQLLLEAVPGWADGYMVFCYRFALDGGDRTLRGRARTEAAHSRLRAALAVLEQARAVCPDHEDDLLIGMAFLIDLVAEREPGLGELLGEDPTVIADRYLAQAETVERQTSAAVMRLFLAPDLCATLLRGDDRDAAVELLAAAVHRGEALRDGPGIADWLRQLDHLRRALSGDPTVDLEALTKDPRLESVLPFLHPR